MPPVLLGIPWPALGGPLRNHFWKKKRPQPYWGGDNSGNALEASNALNYRVWGIPAVLSTGIPGNALRAIPNFSGIASGKCQPYWGYGPSRMGHLTTLRSEQLARLVGIVSTYQYSLVRLPYVLWSSRVGNAMSAMQAPRIRQMYGGGVTAAGKGSTLQPEKITRHRAKFNGVGRGGGQLVFNQILTRFHGIRLKSGWSPVKIRSKSLEIMCFQRVQGVPQYGWKGKIRLKIRLNPSDPICVRPHLPSAEHQNFYNTKKILRGINFVKITKIFSSVNPESGHSCLVFVQYPRDSPRSAWELQNKIGAATNSRKNYKTILQNKTGRGINL